MLGETNRKETLEEFLKIDGLEVRQSSFGDVVRYALEYRYGRPKETFNTFKTTLTAYLLFSSDFNKHFSSGMPKDRLKEAGKSIEERIENSSFEELAQVSLKIAEKVEQANPQEFYEVAVSAYYWIMNETDSFSKAMHYVSTEVRQLLESNNGFLSFRELKALSEKWWSVFIGSPSNKRHRIADDGLTISDVDELKRELVEADNKRKELHQKILAHAKKHLDKDYLDVYIDIMSHESMHTEEYSRLYSPRKGSLIFAVGLIELNSWGPEFSRSFGEEYAGVMKNLIDNGYEALKKAREGAGDAVLWGSPKYKSTIKKDRPEEEDNQLLDRIESGFKDYVSFKGDYLLKDVHGHYLFRKMIAFDTNKVRADSKNPKNRIDDIRNYIISLMPETPKAF